MSPTLQREAEDLLDASAPMPPPRAVVITLDELFDVDPVPHRCRTCGVLLDSAFGDVDGFCIAHAANGRVDNAGRRP